MARTVGPFVHKIFRIGYRLKAAFSQYHNPVPVLGYPGIAKNDQQGSAALKKIEQICRTLPAAVQTASDIGGNSGIYSRTFAERGIFTHYFEPDPDLFSIGFLEAFNDVQGYMSISRLAIDRESIHLLPEVDCTLFLSVMHYWVEQHGWKKALELLDVIWSKTQIALYFEMPNPVQNSKMSQILAEMGQTDSECENFIASFLGKLPGGNVELLDYLYTDFRGNERRHLFLVNRLNAY